MNRSVSKDVLVLTDSKGEQRVEILERMDENEICTVFLKGQINNEASYDVADELFALVSVGKCLILDLKEVTYLTEAFADTLVKLQVRMEESSLKSLPIHNMPETIYSFLKKIGCITSLDYELKEDA